MIVREQLYFVVRCDDPHCGNEIVGYRSVEAAQKSADALEWVTRNRSLISDPFLDMHACKECAEQKGLK